MKSYLLLLFVFLIMEVSASGVTSIIVGENVLVEVFLSDGADVILPEKYSLLEINKDKTSFISKDWIRKDGEWIFVLPKVVTDSYDLKVVLPSGFVLSDGLVYPRGYDIKSDGKSIILEWKNIDEEVIIFYEGVEISYIWVWILIICLIFGGYVFFKIQKMKFTRELERLNKKVKNKNRAPEGVLVSRNLFGEEKRIVEFLVKRKSCWMKDLVRELGISKVMASRKVRSLVEKEILERESFGRENKVSLKTPKSALPS